ncbi:Carboxylesterase bioH [Fibrisoma limi BUZ 3]|uniref:Carboxylesterase bioH n=2 Tax=Fibrisoma limi TaxID=663275 RepID=I2GEC0_9BACT|nr:Carboxylesterase bioH [Fibrisoma limi BUZ 3]
MMSESVALVLLHGHGVDASIWDGIYAGLSTDARVLRPDFSRLTNHSTIEAYAEDLYGRLQNGQVDKCAVIGHSMGGYIALAFAEKYPDMIQGLGLFHSTAFADDEPKKEQRRQVIRKLDEDGTRSFLETAIPNMFAPDNRDAMSEKVHALIELNSVIPPQALQAGIRAMLSRPDRTHVLKNAAYPVLIVTGQHDQIVPPEKSHELAEMAADTELVVLDASGHLGMIEEPEQAQAAIRQFVDRL